MLRNKKSHIIEFVNQLSKTMHYWPASNDGQPLLITFDDQPESILLKICNIAD